MIFLNRLIINISSLKFAILLMLFIAMSSSLGTLIPQGNNTKIYIDIYNSQPLFGIFDGNQILFMGLDHIYTSSWFLTSLVLLCLSLAACSFKRQIPALKSSLKWTDYDNEIKFRKLELSCFWNSKEETELISNSKNILLEKGWEIQINHNRISARKGLIGKLGPIIVHIGLIILLVGSAYGNLTNKTNEQFLKYNEKLDLIDDSTNQKFTIKLEDFIIERETDGKPKQFTSYLKLISNESDEVIYKDAKVNHPIRYKGLTIYQADWSISNIILNIDNKNYLFELKPIPEIGEQIWGVVIELGKENKSNYLLTVDNENGPIKLFDVNNFNETNIYLDREKVTINDSLIEAIQIFPSSGLIIKNDPSIPFIYFSFIVIITGTVLSLIPTKQLWILKDENGDKIFIGGLSNRNLAGFRNEFLNLSVQIKNH